MFKVTTLVIDPVAMQPHLSPLLVGCVYISIRPVFYTAGYTVAASIDEYQEVYFEVGLPDMPPFVYEAYDNAAEAIDAALALKAQIPHLRLWYNGHEDIGEFTDWRSFAKLFQDVNEDWQVVEQVAAGLLASDAPAILEAADYIPLIAVAARKVVP
jgi:hypothetical protein